MNSKRIVITGAPGTGKTAVINALEAAGYVCFPEVIREFTQEETSQKLPEEIKSNPIVFANDSLDFNQKLIAGRKAQYLNAKASAQCINFYDRGLPDVLAYMDFFNQEYPEEFVKACAGHTYDAVFIMPPWKDIFHTDGGRFETYSEAVALHDCLIQQYKTFNYNLDLVPLDTIAARAAYIINKTTALL